jgi:hypothetical protein
MKVLMNHFTPTDLSNKNYLCISFSKSTKIMPVFSNFNDKKDLLDKKISFLSEYFLINNKNNNISLQPDFIYEKIKIFPGLNFEVNDYIEFEKYFLSFINFSNKNKKTTDTDHTNKDCLSILSSLLEFSPYFIFFLKKVTQEHINNSICNQSITNITRELADTNCNVYKKIEKEWNLENKKNTANINSTNIGGAFFISFLETFAAKLQKKPSPPFLKNIYNLFRNKGTYYSFINNENLLLNNLQYQKIPEEINYLLSLWFTELIQSRYLFLRSSLLRGFIYTVLLSYTAQFFTIIKLNNRIISPYETAFEIIQILENLILPCPYLIEYLDKLPAAGILLDKYFSNPAAYKSLYQICTAFKEIK